MFLPHFVNLYLIFIIRKYLMNVADRIAMATLSLTNVSTLASYYSTE